MANPYIKNQNETNLFQKAQIHYTYENLKSNSKYNSVTADSIASDLLKQSILNKVNTEDIINSYKSSLKIHLQTQQEHTRLHKKTQNTYRPQPTQTQKSLI
jgi:hypothetical protein